MYSSPRAACSVLLISSSEEIDMESVDEVPSHSPQYEELVAVAKLNINWPAECHVELQKGKLDKRFLRFKTPPPHRSLLFFPDLHTEVLRSWAKPFFSPPLRPLVRLLRLGDKAELQSNASGGIDARELSVP